MKTLPIFQKRIDKISYLLQKFFSNKAIEEFLGVEYLENLYVAGSCLKSDNPNDIDIFGVYLNQSQKEFDKLIKLGVKIYRTENAVSFKLPNIPIIQFCNFSYDSLQHMVDSFDYSSTKAGINFRMSYYEESQDEFIARVKKCTVKATEVIVTNDFVNYALGGPNLYLGSTYPISSLIRRTKFIKRGENLPSMDILHIMKDILSMRLEDYADYKDQLQALDLNMFIKDGDIDEDSIAFKLYLTMEDLGMIKNPRKKGI